MPLLPAAIGIIFNQDETKILFVKRRDVPIWTLPGGGVEINETAEDALKREILEETGYQVRIVRKCAEYTPINSLSSFTTLFICQIVSGKELISDEVSAIQFYSPSQLPSPLFYIHSNWLKEVLNSKKLIQRPLVETSYFALMKYFILHPFQVLRYAWTRIVN